MSWNRIMAQGIELCDCVIENLAEILRKRVVSDGNDYIAVPYGYDVKNDPDGLLEEDFRKQAWHMSQVPLDADVLARTMSLCMKILENGDLSKPEERKQFWEAGLGIASGVLAPEMEISPFAEEYREATLQCLEPDILDIGYDEDAGILYAWFRVKNHQEETASPIP